MFKRLFASFPLSLLPLMASSGERSATPTLYGPVEGAPVLMGSPPVSVLTDQGYVEQEFFLSGTARSYSGDLPEDGRAIVQQDKTAPYVTRLLVRRPADSTRFNGTVLMEWLNVTGGSDAAPVYSYAHRHLLRQGYAWIGVSAQLVGIEGGDGLVAYLPPLKKADPQRYAQLSHPGDAFSFDIFSQAGKVVAGLDDSAEPAPGLKALRVIAVGESQSAHYLITYFNALDPLHKVFDGALIMGRAASSAPISGDVDLLNRSSDFYAQTVFIRTDVRVPVLELDSETDVLLRGSMLARQPDSEHFRRWEIAGAAHADTYVLSAASQDHAGIAPARLAELTAPTGNVMGMALAKPINAGLQQHYITQAAIHALDRWLRADGAPAHAAGLELNAERRGFVLDEHGNARGGVRSPWVDVPTSVLSGLAQSGERFAMLFGSTEPFDIARLKALYPNGVTDYLEQFADALDGAIAHGFILAADREEIMGVAIAAYPGIAQ